MPSLFSRFSDEFEHQFAAALALDPQARLHRRWKIMVGERMRTECACKHVWMGRTGAWFSLNKDFSLRTFHLYDSQCQRCDQWRNPIVTKKNIRSMVAVAVRRALGQHAPARARRLKKIPHPRANCGMCKEDPNQQFH